MRLLMGTSIVTLATMAIAQRRAAAAMKIPGPLVMGRCSKAAPRMSTRETPYQSGIALPRAVASGVAT